MRSDTLTIPAPAPAAPAAPPAPAGMTPDQLQAIQAARLDGRKVTRAARVAAFSGWSLAVFAAISLLGGLFSLTGFLLGVGMSVVAWVELRGSRGIRRLEPDATRMLGFNQLALGVMMSVYAGWGIIQTLAGPSRYEEEIASGGPQVAEMLEPIAALHTTVAVIFYVSLVVCAVVATGSAAIYYFTRRRHIVAYLQRTPAWVVETVRAVG